jgi:hypothetical protein
MLGQVWEYGSVKYRLYSLLAAALILSGLPGSLSAATIDCAPLRPGSPADSTIEDTVKAHANLLLRALGSGTIENGYRQVEADTAAKYPNADKLLLWREYLYVSCTLLAASSHWSDDDKWDRWMRLMNRWSAEPPAEAAPVATPPPPSQPSPPTAGYKPAPANSGATKPLIGGIGLGTGLAQIQMRKDIALSLDSDGNPYGEETFTFAYGQAPGARQLDGDVVFGLRDNAVASITVSHTLHSTSCEDSGTAAAILNQQIHDWGAPLRRTAPTPANDVNGGTSTYTFRADDTDMVLVFRTLPGAGGAPICRASINYQRSVGPK